MAHDVFISHSAKDKAVADAVCAALENAGVRCWIAPRDVQPGRSFAGEITRAIQQSKTMVLIFSAHSNGSEQVLREVQLAVTEHLHIVQLRIEDVRPNDDLTYFLSTPHWLDAMTPPLEKHLQRLVTAVNALLGADGAEGGAATARTPAPAPAAGRPIHKTSRSAIWIWVGLVLLFGFAWPVWRYYVAATRRPASSFSTLSASPTAAAGGANEVVVEWAGIDTRAAAGDMVGAAPYLNKAGIWITDEVPKGSEIVIVNNLGLYEGKAVFPTTSQNMLTQVKTANGPASFTLKFAQPVDSISFTRPALYPATGSGISHPAWSIHALGTSGEEVGSQREKLIRADSDDVSARTYTLRAPYGEPIAALRFDSDPTLNGKPFAAFSTLLIERITFVPAEAR
jgi:hypothetical protein